ncbi:MAG: NAD(P)-binding domain-containing protein, partial [Actinobacteria bacterium]|nr:NAD(P)-binding domain-containing protein [Actinomycetota bacterium]
MNQNSDIGVVGLGVMGANLALNFSDSGNRGSVYNRTTSVTDDFMAGPAAGMGIAPATTLEELVGQLGSPRVVLLMVKAGAAVDAVIGELVPLLEDGDI